MFEPRTARDLTDRHDLKYIGGVERLDLWAVFLAPDDDVIEVMPLVRIHVVGGNMSEWDLFKLPLLDNNELSQSEAPDQRRICGMWDDVRLTHEEVNLVETYLRCFAPWVLGRNLTEENNNE